MGDSSTGAITNAMQPQRRETCPIESIELSVVFALLWEATNHLIAGSFVPVASKEVAISSATKR